MPKNTLVRTLRPLLLVTALFLSACSGLSPSDSSRSSPGPGGEYIGWHCEGAIESSDHWNCSEQLLKGGELVSPAQIPSQVEADTLESKSAEPAEPASDISISEPKPKPEPEPDSELASSDSSAELIPVFDISANGYTVQLGAYLSQTMAEQAADNIRLTGGELRVRDIVDGERYLFVLVYGQYSSRQQAEIATEQLIELNPGLNYWVRSIASMRKQD
jgi:septal ring-binding cell division protein DamX